MPNKKQTIVFSIAHVYDLIFFYRIVKETSIKKEYHVKVIFFLHVFFNNKMELARSLLSKISKDITYVDSSQTPYYQKNIFKNIYLGIKLKKLLRKNFLKSDTVLMLDKSHLHSHIIINFFKNPVLFQFFGEKIDKFSQIRFLKTLVANLINFFLNNSLIKIFQLKNTKTVENYVSNLKHIKVLYINYSSSKNNLKGISFSRPEITSSNKIVIFGGRYLGWDLQEEQLQKVRKYYLSIYKEFKNKFKFYYIAHPKEKDEFEELNKIFENNLNLVENFLNSEHYLVENNDIAYCFSIGSTSSLSAYKMGFNSKVVYRSIFQDDEIVKGYDSIFEDTDESIHINNDFSDLRKETVEENISKKDFSHLFNIVRENYEMSNMSK